MMSPTVQVLLASLSGVFIIVLANRWLMQMIRPRSGGRRFLLYLVIMLMLGFVLTVLYSHFILRVVSSR